MCASFAAVKLHAGSSALSTILALYDQELLESTMILLWTLYTYNSKEQLKAQIAVKNSW